MQLEKSVNTSNYRCMCNCVPFCVGAHQIKLSINSGISSIILRQTLNIRRQQEFRTYFTILNPGKESSKATCVEFFFRERINQGSFFFFFLMSSEKIELKIFYPKIQVNFILIFGATL